MRDRYDAYLDRRTEYFRRLSLLSRRDFVRASGLAAAGAAAFAQPGPHSFQSVEVQAQGLPFTFAYLSDSHLFERALNERFVRAILKAVDDINDLDPQPDFVLFGGDLAQLGQEKEIEEGAQILKAIKAPVRMMVGEHDWYLDLGEAWRKRFGKDVYSFDHKGVHFAVLNSVIVDDYWTANRMSRMERMVAMARMDNPATPPFRVGESQRDWLRSDLANLADETPVIVFSHSPLYKIYRRWNFWTEDAEQVQALLARFKSATVIHGHTHQMLSHRIGSIHFHGMLSTAWPWPYAPEGLPKLTVRMNRADPLDEFDGCGNGSIDIAASGRVDKNHNLWSRRPIKVSARYLDSDGLLSRPPRETDVNY
jgi:3',5'-cyclic-AMP phosphodiesterase